MKTIINGKKYDTETATCVAEWDNGVYGAGDFHRCAEALYQTKNGSFFLHGEGGALSSYAESCGQNSWCGGEKIIPMTEGEVRVWLEGRGLAKDYEEIFGVCEDA